MNYVVKPSWNDDPIENGSPWYAANSGIGIFALNPHEALRGAPAGDLSLLSP